MDVQPWEAGRTLEKLIGGKFKKLGEYSRTEAERTFQEKLGNTREAGGTLEKLGQHSRSWGKTREAGKILEKLGERAEHGVMEL